MPEESYTIPFGEANVVREGNDVTIVASARWSAFAEEAADSLAKRGSNARSIDPRTTSPIDVDTILESVEKTGRLVWSTRPVRAAGWPRTSSAMVAQEAFERPEGADPRWSRAAHAGAVLARVGGRLRAHARDDRRRHPRDHRGSTNRMRVTMGSTATVAVARLRGAEA